MAEFYDWETDKNNSTPENEAKKVPQNEDYFNIGPDYSDYDISSSADYDQEDLNIYSTRKRSARKTQEQMDKEAKKTKITAICCLCAILITCLFSFFYLNSIPKLKEADTEITLVIVYPNSEVDTLPITTSAKFLGDAITDAGYAESDDHSTDTYKTLNGVTTENNAKWVFTRDGKELTLSVNKTPIEDGETYTATYTEAENKK